MAYKKRFDTSSAYGQLIILVFLPICLLAAVGGILVFYETMRASNSEQEALAEAVLIRYTPTIAELVPELLEQEQVENSDDKNKAADNPQAAITALEGIQDRLGRMQSEQHVQRIAIINQNNEVLASVGYGTEEAWPLIESAERFLSQQPTPIGTAYGSSLGEFDVIELKYLFKTLDCADLRAAFAITTYPCRQSLSAYSGRIEWRAEFIAARSG